MRWRSAFSLWFRNLAFLGCVHREERFRPDFIRPAQARCMVKEPNQIAVGIQVILLCGLNQAVDHSAEPGAGRRVASAHSSGPSQRALGCARHGCCSVPACRPPDSATDTATAPADSAALSPGRVRAPLWAGARPFLYPLKPYRRKDTYG